MPNYPDSLGRLLNFSTTACNNMCNAMLSEHGLSLPQWVILSALWRKDGMLVSELAGYTQSNLPAVSRLIERMEKNGFVKREMDIADRRAVRVFLSAEAKKLSSLMDFYHEVNTRLMDGFSKKEIDQLFKMLERIINNASKY